MDIMKRLALGIGASALVLTPVAASATTSASKSSVTYSQHARGAAPVTDANEMEGGNPLGLVMLAIVGAGMVYVLYELIKGDDHPPTSP